MIDRKASRVTTLLDEHKATVIEQLGACAFELMTPRETAEMIGIEPKRIPDLIREGWLDWVPGKDIGHAHQYYRWRVTFVQQFRRTRQRTETP
jgi:hypothetical protein